MKLSQDRTRSVLEYVLDLDISDAQRKWIQELLTANGLSSSKPIYKNSREDQDQSRRVEFRIVMNAEIQLKNIATTK